MRMAAAGPASPCMRTNGRHGARAVKLDLVGAPQSVTWFGEDRVRERDMLARWTVAFSLATMAHLREESHLEQDLQARAWGLHLCLSGWVLHSLATAARGGLR